MIAGACYFFNRFNGICPCLNRIKDICHRNIRTPTGYR